MRVGVENERIKRNRMLISNAFGIDLVYTVVMVVGAVLAVVAVVKVMLECLSLVFIPSYYQIFMDQFKLQVRSID